MEQQLNHTAWLEPPRKRLSQWREFRKSLDTTNIEEVCKLVIEWWQFAPLVNIAIDPVNHESWPTPWEMLHQGNFCENSLALGMSYTIYYANPDIQNELVYIICHEQSKSKLCALIDNKHLLNFDFGSISTIPDGCFIDHQVKIKDIVNN